MTHVFSIFEEEFCSQDQHLNFVAVSSSYLNSLRVLDNIHPTGECDCDCDEDSEDFDELGLDSCNHFPCIVIESVLDGEDVKFFRFESIEHVTKELEKHQTLIKSTNKRS